MSILDKHVYQTFDQTARKVYASADPTRQKVWITDDATAEHVYFSSDPTRDKVYVTNPEALQVQRSVWDDR